MVIGPSTRIGLAKKAARRRLFQSRFEDLPSIIVVSPGGVGTTFVIKHIARFAKVNDPYDRDDLKHLPSPPYVVEPEPKVLFISGDPNRSMQSIIRRGWFQIQAAKLGGVLSVLLPDSTFTRRAYLQCLKRQQHKWAGYRGRILFVDFEDLWERATEIQEFLGMPKDFADTFPERRGRNT